MLPAQTTCSYYCFSTIAPTLFGDGLIRARSTLDLSLVDTAYWQFKLALTT